jgi:hypothetical protein
MNKIFSISMFIMLMLNISIFAENKTLKTGGVSSRKWESNGSWIPSGIPTASDDVIITAASAHLIIDVNAVCASFTIETGYSGKITIPESFTLTVSGNWTNSGTPANCKEKNIANYLIRKVKIWDSNNYC